MLKYNLHYFCVNKLDIFVINNWKNGCFKYIIDIGDLNEKNYSNRW